MQPENFKITSFENIKKLSKKNINYLTIATSFKLDPAINLASDLNISTENIIELLFKQNSEYKNFLSCFETGELKNSKLNRYVLIGFNPYASISYKNYNIKSQNIQGRRELNQN